MDPGRRGGGDAPRPDATGRWPRGSTTCCRSLSRNVADHAAAETHGSALELFTRPHATVAGAAGELADLRAGLAADLEPLGLRAAVAGTHAFAQWARHRGLARRALSVDLRHDARARAARADVRAARARRRARSRVRAPGAPRAARPRPAAARAGRELTLLAGPRHRPRLDPGAGVRRLPARRHPARVRQLRRVRRGGRRAAALRRVPGADLPVVGRAAAAQARHDRGAHHGRADARRRQRGAARRWCSASCAWRRPRASPSDQISRAARGARREPLPRHARRDAGRVPRPGGRDAAARARHPRRGARRVRAARRAARLRGELGERAAARGRAGLRAPAGARRASARASGRRGLGAARLPRWRRSSACRAPPPLA